MERQSNKQPQDKILLPSLYGPAPNSTNRLPNQDSLPLVSIKLNTRKLPIDFFGKIQRTNSSQKPAIRSRVFEKNLRNSKDTPKTDRAQRSGYNLPEAEITCFFKMAQQQKTQPTIPSPRLSQMPDQQNLSYQYSAQTSIQLTSFENLNEDCLSCTFAKKRQLPEGHTTPTRQKQIEPMSDTSLTEKKRSVRIQKEHEKNRFQCTSSKSYRNNNLTTKGKRVNKRLNQPKAGDEFFLPPIN